MELIPIVGVLASSTMVVLIVYFVTRARQRRVEVQAEMQSRLIDKFGSAPEFVQFLHSDRGRQFVQGVGEAPAVIARERILSGLTRAIVLTCLGLAFLGLTFFYEENFAVPAAVIFSLGLGYLLSTLLSYKLSAKLTPSSESTIDRG
jgi:hypothetical protein